MKLNITKFCLGRIRTTSEHALPSGSVHAMTFTTPTKAKAISPSSWKYRFKLYTRRLLQDCRFYRLTITCARKRFVTPNLLQETHKFFPSPNTRVTKSRRMRHVGVSYVHAGFWAENLKGRDQLKDLAIDGRGEQY
jgi:hypothetical protein